MILSFEDFLKYGLTTIDSESGCVLWGKTFFENGYGRYKDKRAHRVSWELTNGVIPNNLLVLHRCDVRNCINPNHLFLGTQYDNMQDMIKKGRKLVLAGYENYTTTDEYKSKVSGDNHWTRRHPERIAKGNRHWSKLHPEKFSELSKDGKYKSIKKEEKGSE